MKRLRNLSVPAAMLSTLILIMSQALAFSLSFPQALVQTIPREYITNPTYEAQDKARFDSYVVKKCSASHIGQAVELLADASTDGAASFQRMIQKLKLKSAFEQQLQSRHKCIVIAERHIMKNEVDTLRSSHSLRVDRLWKDDTFRYRMNEAISHASEKIHGWGQHNFALTPSVEKLQHSMFVVLCRDTNDVVGFCEISMLSSPSQGELNRLRPTIMNLVVSKSHRRRGLGQKLVESSRRYTRRYFYQPNDSVGMNAMSMGLYVHDKNEAAKRLYNKLGFDSIYIHQTEENIEDDLCYMECGLGNNDFYGFAENVACA